MLVVERTGDARYFYREDGWGELWELGYASLNIDGTAFDGYFDTKAISFDDDAHFERIIAKRGYHDEIDWR